MNSIGLMEWSRGEGLEQSGADRALAEGLGYPLTTMVRWNVPGDCRRGWRKAGGGGKGVGVLREVGKTGNRGVSPDRYNPTGPPAR